MQVIAALGVRGEGKDRKSWSIFKCPACEKLVEKPTTSGMRNNSCGDKVCRRKMFTPNPNCRGNAKEDAITRYPFYSSIKERYRLLKQQYTMCTEWQTLRGFMKDMYPSYALLRKTHKSVVFTVEGVLATKDNSTWKPAGRYTRFAKLSATHTSYTYVVKVNEFYKIGHTKHLHSRMGALQTASPYEVVIVCAVPVVAGSETEQILHNRYMDYNVRGEWFSLSQEQVNDITMYLDSL